MPFTISHAAAAIPFRRTRLIMSAIVMGCFAPDFPHFLSLSPRKSLDSPHALFSHTFAGIFVFDLPLAIAGLWLFHAIIKQPMLMFLPVGIRRRLRESVNSFPFWPWKRFLLITLSIVIGTATHLLLDAFTHHYSWIYQNWALLRRLVKLPLVGEMSICNLLEYASSILGLAVLAVWIQHWYHTTEPSAERLAQPLDAPQSRAFVAVLPVFAILGGALRVFHEKGIQLHIRPIVHFTAEMLISAITYFLLGLLVYGLIIRRHRVVPVRV